MAHSKTKNKWIVFRINTASDELSHKFLNYSRQRQCPLLVWTGLTFVGTYGHKYDGCREEKPAQKVSDALTKLATHSKEPVHLLLPPTDHAYPTSSASVNTLNNITSINRSISQTWQTNLVDKSDAVNHRNQTSLIAHTQHVDMERLWKLVSLKH